ncbi:MAG: saccharopine dehydrogenase-like NADP-dependent oxidoreductase [Porticoccaceae bacterium]|jgi:saccharopine dehydrogenase-like NADP-dependent oxidoreductase
MGGATGIPFALAAIMISRVQIERKGVFLPELFNTTALTLSNG